MQTQTDEDKLTEQKKMEKQTKKENIFLPNRILDEARLDFPQTFTFKIKINFNLEYDLKSPH